ncbi:MAG: methyltransferase domain-containing protein [Anaerolineae bacterium]|nr:methyltransferase domain-containing protein [Anaerolineae bacterium]
MKSVTEIQTDFDRIALAENARGAEAWNHNNHYHDYLLRHAPAQCANALEIGCGTGAFARLLAQRAEHVLALDLSAEMLRFARERSTEYANIDYVQADVMMMPLPANSYDCIASIATLHHLDLSAILPKLKAALKPGGVLLVLDLYTAATPGDLLQNVVSVPYHRLLMRRHGGSAPPNPEANAAWNAHGSTDVYPTIAEVRRACASLMPGANVTRHLLWRYSLVWAKPNAIPTSE